MKDATIIVGERTVTRDELMKSARRTAAGFARLGLKEDERVALLLRNDIPFLVAMQAVNLLGAYSVPLNWHGSPDELIYVINDSAPRILIAHADLIAPLRPLLPPSLEIIVVPTPDDIGDDFGIPASRRGALAGDRSWDAWLSEQDEWAQASKPPRTTFIYTSGTTGHPKGVRREAATPEQATAMRTLFEAVYNVRPGARAYVGGPLYHASPNAFARQATQIAELLVLSTKFDPEQLLALIERHKLTTVIAVPTMFVKLLKLPEDIRNKYDVTSLEWVFHTGAPCPPDVKRAMIDWWGPVLVETYGGTEMGIVTRCMSDDWLTRPGTVGRAAPGAVIRVFDADGNSVPAGTSGEIFARNDAYPQFAYHGRASARDEVHHHGLISLGDIGYLDADDYLFINDRKRDMIISGGTNIYPAEIENVLTVLDGVKDCAVFGIPDAEFGEQICAAIELEPGANITAADVTAFVADRLAKFKVPRRIDFVASLPREESGKIFKRRLREPFWAERDVKV
jgi:long-chain acyl-CoA synthetase